MEVNEECWENGKWVEKVARDIRLKPGMRQTLSGMVGLERGCARVVVFIA